MVSLHSGMKHPLDETQPATRGELTVLTRLYVMLVRVYIHRESFSSSSPGQTYIMVRSTTRRTTATIASLSTMSISVPEVELAANKRTGLHHAQLLESLLLVLTLDVADRHVRVVVDEGANVGQLG
jgi:hypothetical protein